jgi:hypothetical protein
MTESKWITIEHRGTSASGKTDVWTVRPNEADEVIGVISWFGRWRRYAFFPANNTVFEQDCLRDIANFCEHATKARMSPPPVKMTT